MKLVKQEHLMEEDLREAQNFINVEFKFTFATEATDTEDQEIYKFILIITYFFLLNLRLRVVE
mgnify:CR=1 FL=1